MVQAPPQPAPGAGAQQRRGAAIVTSISEVPVTRQHDVSSLADLDQRLPHPGIGWRACMASVACG